VIYFISDTHFYHQNIIRLNPEVRKYRFEERIMESLEELLKEGDIIYHIGDFTWELNDSRGILERWKRLKAHKVLVLGNHDLLYGKELLGEFFDEVHEFSTILEVEGVRLLLSHYPALDLRTERFPDRQERVVREFISRGCDGLVHGHVHYNSGGPMCGCSLKGIRCVNVNVELHDFKPVSLSQILREMRRHQGNPSPLYPAP